MQLSSNDTVKSFAVLSVLTHHLICRSRSLFRLQQTGEGPVANRAWWSSFCKANPDKSAFAMSERHSTGAQTKQFWVTRIGHERSQTNGLRYQKPKQPLFACLSLTRFSLRHGKLRLRILNTFWFQLGRGLTPALLVASISTLSVNVILRQREETLQNNASSFARHHHALLLRVHRMGAGECINFSNAGNRRP